MFSRPKEARTSQTIEYHSHVSIYNSKERCEEGSTGDRAFGGTSYVVTYTS